ncbi:MAG: SwmB domain-containing protein [bacterium]|nr:SwmB domain-containing protein [bacterium]
MTLTLAEAVLAAAIDTVTVAYTEPATGKLKDADHAGLPVTGFVGAKTVTNNTPADTTLPTLQSASVNGRTVKLIFSEALDETVTIGGGPALPFFQQIVGGSLTNATNASVSGRTVTLTFPLSGQVRHGQRVNVWYSAPPAAARQFRDLSGNRLATTNAGDWTVTNNTPPAFSSAAVNGATLEITFDGELATDAGSLPAAGDFAVTVGGSAADLAEGDPVIAGATVTLTLASAVIATDAVTVSYTPGANKLKDHDAAMNPVPAFTGQTATNNTEADTTVPAVESIVVNGSTLTVTFDEDLDESVTVPGTTFRARIGAGPVQDATSVSVSGRAVTVTLATAARHGQSVTVWNATGGPSNTLVKDRSGNEMEIWGFDGRTATNNTPPAFSSAAVNGATLEITFDGALDESSVPAAGDFAVTVDGSAAALADTNPVAVNGAVVTLTLAKAVLRVDAVTVSYTPGTNKLKDSDHAGLPVTGFVDAKTATNNTPADGTAPGAPTIDLVRIVSWPTHDADADGTHDTYIRGDRILVDVVFDEEVAVTGAGDVRLRLDVGANDADQLNSRKTLALQGVYIGGRTLRFAYTVGVGSDCGTDSASGDCDSDGVWVQVDQSNNQVVWEPHADQKVVSAITGVAANLTTNHLIEDLPATLNPRHKVDGAKTGVAGPTVESATVNGPTLTVTFDKNLAAPADPVELRRSLTVRGAGTIHGGDPNDEQSPRGVSVSGKRLTLTLGAGARAGETVMLSYGGNELKGADGERAPMFRDLAVTNATPGAARPTPLSATVSHTTLQVVFDGPLDGASAPAGSAFLVEAQRLDDSLDYIRGTGTAAVSGNMVTVRLAKAPEENELVSVSYTRPDANPLQGAVRDRPAVLSFRGFTVGTVVLVDIEPPTFEDGEAIEIESAGMESRAVLRFNEALDESSVPAAGDFEVRLDDDPATVTDVAVRGNSVVLTVNELVTMDFLVSYTPGTNPIRDRAGNNAAELSNEELTVLHGSGAPVFQSATVDGVRVTLTYNRTLDPSSLPAPGAFSFHLPDHPTDGRRRYGRNVTAVAVEGKTLVLSLDHPVHPCGGVYFAGDVPRIVQQPFTVTYEKPATDPVRQLDGTDAVAFAARAVTNARAGQCKARINGAREGSVILTAERPFAKDSELRKEWFTVTASGGPVTVTGAAFSAENPRELVLTLDRAFAPGETATVSYRRPEGARGLWDVDGNQLADVVDMPVAMKPRAAPAAPAAPTLAQASETSVTLTWPASDAVGQATVTGYGVRYRQHGAAEWAGHAHTGTGTSATIPALVPGYRFEAQVRATGPGGDSPWSDSGWGHTGAARFVSATTEEKGRGLFLTFTKDILISGLHTAYTVRVDGERRATRQAFWEDNTVGLVLLEPVWSGQTVTVAYARPSGRTRLHDADELAIDSFGPETVSNVSTAAAPLPPLTASFAGLPARHDGASRFTFELVFSEDFGGRLDYRVLRDQALQAAGGRVTDARRLAQYANRAWIIEVRPWSAEDVTVTLAVTTDCAADGAVCTPDGRPLSNSLTATVAGPPRNTPATGAPTITGTAQAGETLSASTAGIADGDGLTGARFAWQWIANDGAGDTDIAGATAASYTLADADVGKRIKVRVAFTDDRGHAEALTSAPTAAVVPRPLLASFVGVPAEHDGKKLFSFELVFSDNFGGRFDYKALRDRALQVSGGRVVDAKRLAPGRNDRWTISVRPASYEAVTVTLPAGSVVTESGRTLANTLTATVTGPALLSVADARGEEGVDAALTFAVSLSRAASGPVTVDYVTLDGTAVAGEDYTRTRGTLTFAPGETEKSVAVPILDDAIDEGEETFTLKLRNAQGAWLLDGEATGTIENDDPMPKAWTARFGRTVAVHVVDAVEARLEGASESWVQVGGHRLGGPAADVHETVRRLAPERDLWAEAEAADPAGQTRTFRDLLLGSAFHLASNGEDAATGPRLSAWGRVATSGFDGVEDKVSLDGTVTTATLGVDGVWKRWLTGLVLAYSEGDGSFTHTDMPGGDLTSSLTSLHPYVSYTLNDRVRLWGVVGYGSGALRLSLADQAPMDTDLTMRMGAVGVRGTLLQPSQPGGLQLAVRSDVLWMGMDSAAAHNLAATQADASRLRLVLEGSRPVALAGGGSFVPSLEVGLRHDGGDAETGTGVEVGGRLRYASAWGLSIEASVRTLLAHEAADYTEWGASGALRFDPGRQGKGFTASVVPTWGAAASGTSRLWDQQGATGLVPADALAPTAAGRLDAELGYGVATLRGRGLLTPYARVALTEGADQAWHLGTRLLLAESLNFSLEASRRAREGETAAHELALRANLGF